MELVGRLPERKIIEELLANNRSDFLAVYGRRRIGKTYLIDQVCNANMAFSFNGLHNVALKDQLQHFANNYLNQTGKFIPAPKSWLEAFQLLIQHLTALPEGKKVVFIDELPWLNTPKSNFLSCLENFWNTWANKRNDILLVVCGSAASWMIKNIVQNKGGLHNRITRTIRLLPFNLSETEMLLKQNGVQFTRYQIAQLYMITGGIPYYLMNVRKGKSIDQTVNELCFNKDGLLRNEFEYVFQSLFENPTAHQAIIMALSQKNIGLTRTEILKQTGLSNAGSTTRLLEELEESGFITKYIPFQNKTKDALYRIIDFYTIFYLQFVQKRKNTANTFLTISRLPNWTIWQGIAFENIAFQHVAQIKQKLGISGVNTQQGAWFKKGSDSEKGSQIDLLIDRDDAIISICEVKFSNDIFTIQKEYAQSLRHKLATFKDNSGTRKAVFLTLISTYGLQKNDYFFELVQNEVTLDDLFL
jgi:uncharacterized protein